MGAQQTADAQEIAGGIHFAEGGSRLRGRAICPRLHEEKAGQGLGQGLRPRGSSSRGTGPVAHLDRRTCTGAGARLSPTGPGRRGDPREAGRGRCRRASPGGRRGPGRRGRGGAVGARGRPSPAWGGVPRAAGFPGDDLTAPRRVSGSGVRGGRAPGRAPPGRSPRLARSEAVRAALARGASIGARTRGDADGQGWRPAGARLRSGALWSLRGQAAAATPPRETEGGGSGGRGLRAGPGRGWGRLDGCGRGSSPGAPSPARLRPVTCRVGSRGPSEAPSRSWDEVSRKDRLLGSPSHFLPQELRGTMLSIIIIMPFFFFWLHGEERAGQGFRLGLWPQG